MEYIAEYITEEGLTFNIECYIYKDEDFHHNEYTACEINDIVFCGEKLTRVQFLEFVKTIGEDYLQEYCIDDMKRRYEI